MRKSLPHNVLLSVGVAIGLVAGAIPALAQGQEKLDPKGVEFFEKNIRPVLVETCYKCHSAGADKVKAGLEVDTRAGLLKGGESGAAIVPGQPANSLLIEALKHDGLKMPPDRKLPANVIAAFEKWIEMGAPDPRMGAATATAETGYSPKKEINWDEARNFWSFSPIAKPLPPAVKNAAWPRNDIDRFLLARMEAAGVKPLADADPRVLLRRVYDDLVGLPPTPEETDAFVADHSPQALAKVVDRLLASPQFGERWGRHWLDVVHYAESNGNVDNNAFPHAWRYRDWVIDAINADKPFDRFATEQLAGDLLPARTPAERNANLVATGMLALTSKPRAQNNPDYVMDLVADQIEVSTVGFMGLTVGCARCHDHKFDPIPQREYYSLAGIFESTTMLHGGGGRRNNNKRNNPVGPLHQLDPTDEADAAKLARIDAQQSKIEAQLGKARAELASLEGEPTSSGRTSKGKKANDKKAKQKNAKQAARAKNPGNFAGNAKRRATFRELVIALAEDENGGQGGKDENAKREAQEKAASVRQKKIDGLNATIASLEAELEKLEAEKPAPAGVAMGLRDGNPKDSPIRLRGESQRRGDVVSRGFVTVGYIGQPAPVDPTQSGRLQLAQWIASRDNPLTARVQVNRMWRYLFGQGLVRTVDNFGALGEKPSHPELLDYLATRFIESGWSMKQTIREIVLSRAYQLASSHDAKNIEIDADNVLVWRHPVRRRDAESLRDAVLATSGALDLTRPSGSIVAQAGNGLIQNGAGDRYAQYEDACRSVYLPMVRNSEPEMLTIFDLPDTELVVGDRSVTTVPAQGLFLLNSEFIRGHSRRFAERVLASAGADDAARMRTAWRMALGREPTADEQSRVAELLKQASGEPVEVWAAVCQTLMASAEFRYVE